MPELEHPFYPIIYVRGYAMTQGEIDDTVATPYMGFNLGSTKIRQNWEGKVKRHIFESPLIRLMKEYEYKDIYHDGMELKGQLPPRSVIIYRYYEQADSELGKEDAPTIPEAARGLSDLILKIRQQVCEGSPQFFDDFKVYLVAHSMGGLVCRCFLQNPEHGDADARALVDKVFTYATPHNGIEMAGLNVPKFMGIWDMNNFNREKMAAYLGLGGTPDRVDSLNGMFDPARFFCLVGTNHKDYNVAAGLSSKFAGEMSDGLVRINNAVVHEAPRAYVHRSHSGYYGIVNSEEGYQNLVRFLFGDLQVDGCIEVENLPLPPSIQQAKDEGKKIRASYFFEATVSPRGALTYKMTERRKETYSAILRQFDELFKYQEIGLDKPRSPFMFSVFLDSDKLKDDEPVTFSIELAVSTTEYEIVNDVLFFDRSIPGEYLFRNTVVIKASKSPDGFDIRYVLSDESWGEGEGEEVHSDENGTFIPLSSVKGFQGKLHLNVNSWNE